MRIIAGSARGRKLVEFDGLPIRPTLDRVKESFFNQTGPWLEDIRFLDLFAGTGNMGIEALSRGAKRTVFVENNLQARRIVLSNIKRCRFSQENDAPISKDLWSLLSMSALSALPLLEKSGECFDLIYLDPPFDANLYEPCMEILSSSRILGPSALIVVEHERKNILKNNYGRLDLLKDRRIGDTCLSFFHHS